MNRNVKNRFRQGKIGETLALNFLLKKGFRLLRKNYHIRGGEIDLILTKDDILFFVEVKTRWSKSFGLAEDAVTPAKKRRLLKAIYTYLHAQQKFFRWRCDLVAIQFVNSYQATVKHITDIFTE